MTFFCQSKFCSLLEQGGWRAASSHEIDLARFSDSSPSSFLPTFVDPILPPSTYIPAHTFVLTFCDGQALPGSSTYTPFAHSLISTCGISSAPIPEKEKTGITCSDPCLLFCNSFLVAIFSLFWAIYPLPCCLGHLPQIQLRSYYTIPGPFSVAKRKLECPRLLFITLQ